MRGVFILSLLIGVAILAYNWSNHTAAVSKSNSHIQKEMAPVSGHGHDGGDITTSAQFLGDPKGLAVTDVKPKSYFDEFFGLKTDDVIVTAGDVDLRGIDEASAVTFVYEAAQKKRDLVVLRGGQRVTLAVK